MRLPFLRPKADPSAPRRPAPFTGDDAGAVQAARTRARQRLVGALVLLVLGVVSFPLLFETQPRPMPGDIPVVARDGAGSAPPAARGTRPLAPLPVLPAEAGNEAPATAAAAASAGGVGAPPQAEPAQAVAARPPPDAAPAAASAAPAAPPKPVPPPPAPATAPTATAAAPASAAAPDAARFVVQVGAFAEERALREARQKVEKLGLKTYIQVIDAAGAKRTRVRVGPFETREQAEAAAKKLKAGGLPAAILTL